MTIRVANIVLLLLLGGALSAMSLVAGQQAIDSSYGQNVTIIAVGAKPAPIKPKFNKAASKGKAKTAFNKNAGKKSSKYAFNRAAKPKSGQRPKRGQSSKSIKQRFKNAASGKGSPNKTYSRSKLINPSKISAKSRRTPPRTATGWLKNRGKHGISHASPGISGKKPGYLIRKFNPNALGVGHISGLFNNAARGGSPPPPPPPPPPPAPKPSGP